MDVFRQKWLYSGKLVVFGQIGFILYKIGCIRKKLLYSVKSESIWAKVLLFVQIGCI